MSEYPARMPNTIRSVDGGHLYVTQMGDKRTGPVQDGGKPRGVLHTTETKHISLLWSRGLPHLAIGPEVGDLRIRVHQFIPFTDYATTLRNESGGIETNRLSRCQIEQAGYSSRDPWLPSKEQASVTASVLEWCQQELGIPEEYPYDIADVKSGVWATPSNPWRRSGKFRDRAGWHGHIAVPENDHWDPGAEMVNALLARELPPVMVTAHQAVARVYDGTKWRTVPLSPHYKALTDLYRWQAAHPRRVFRAMRGRVVIDGKWRMFKAGRVHVATRRVEASKAR